MAEKKDIEALFQKIREADPRAVLVVYSTREGDITTMEMAGYESKDVPMLAHYTRFRFDKMMVAYFTRHAQASQPSPPLMRAPSSNSDLGSGIQMPNPRRPQSTPVAKSVRAAIKESKAPKKKR